MVPTVSLEGGRYHEPFSTGAGSVPDIVSMQMFKDRQSAAEQTVDPATQVLLQEQGAKFMGSSDAPAMRDGELVKSYYFGQGIFPQECPADESQAPEKDTRYRKSLDTFQLKARASLGHSHQQATPKGPNARMSIVSSLKMPSSLERSNEELTKVVGSKAVLNSKSSQ